MSLMHRMLKARSYLYPAFGTRLKVFPNSFRMAFSNFCTGVTAGCSAKVRTKLLVRLELQCPTKSVTGGLAWQHSCLIAICKSWVRHLSSPLKGCLYSRPLCPDFLYTIHVNVLVFSLLVPGLGGVWLSAIGLIPAGLAPSGRWSAPLYLFITSALDANLGMVSPRAAATLVMMCALVVFRSSSC